MKVYFPEDQIAQKLIEAINEEQKSLKIAVFTITHKGIVDAIIRAKQRGVAVEMIVDPLSIDNVATIKFLLEGKIPLFVWEKGVQMKKEKKRRGLMQNKFCVFGGNKVWTGSFNFTYDADHRHRENALFVEDRKLASEYLREFSKMQSIESRSYYDYITLYPKKNKQKNKAQCIISS